MTSITFNTLAFTRHLQQAGFDEKQAETVVDVLAESQENLVTREHFDSEIKLMCSEMREMETCIMGEQKLNRWMLAIIIAATVLPLLKNLL